MTTIWVQCEVVQVRLKTAPLGAASDLERLVMRAIGAGVDNVTELTSYFGLPETLMLDLVGDLWRAERVVLEFDEQAERIELSSNARDELAAGGEIESSLHSATTESMLFDTLSGRVLTLRAGRNYPRDRRLIVPRQPDDPRPQDLRTGNLVDAVSFALEKQGGSIEQIGGRRIVSANLVPRIVTNESRTQYVALEVQAAVDAGDGLQVQLIDSAWPLTVQRAATERLQRLVGEQPTSAFVRALRAEASRRVVGAPSLGARLARLASTAATLGSTDANHRQSSHDSLRQAFADLGHYVGDMAAREVSARVLHSAEEHRRAIEELIDTATTQLVIALPWIHMKGLAPYLGPLEAAVRRGVGVTVLWGIERSDATLDARAMAAFDDLHRSASTAGRGGFVHIDRRQSSHIHAKVLIRDDSAAMVTSKNFFSGSDLFEVGVVVEAPLGTGSPLVADLVTWTYQTTPNFAHAGSLVRDQAVYRREPAPPAFMAPQTPELDTTTLRAAAGSPAAQLWARSWQAAVSELERVAHRPSPVPYVVADGLHHSLLTTALREAQNRIVVASGKLSQHVVTNDFLRQLEDCLKRGVRISLYFGALSRADDAPARERLHELAASGVGRLEVVERAGGHAKVLIFDDDVVIGSYNYLSFDAVYGAGRRRQRAEISLRLISPAVADHVTKFLATTRERTDELFPFVPASSAEPPPALGASRLTAMLAAGALEPTAVAEVVPNVAAHAEIRTELVAAGATATMLTRLDAALVASSPEGALLERAREELVVGLWGQGLVVPAAALRTTTDGAWAPSRALTDAVAARVLRAREAPGLAEDLALADPHGPDALCLASIEVVESLREGELAALSAATLVEHPELVTLRDAARAFVARYGALLPAQVGSDDPDHEEPCRALVTAIDRVAGWRNTGSLQTTEAVAWMVAGPLGELRRAAEGRDAAAVARWVETYPGGVDGDWLDEMVRRADTGVTVHSSHRRRLITWTKEILVGARRLARTARAYGTASLVDPAERDAAAAVVTSAQDLLAALPDTVESSGARARTEAWLDELGVSR
jgi:phosphatidylserine/phosphatidylglycerophosphate/cardiolipin synthase-like enzyme